MRPSPGSRWVRPIMAHRCPACCVSMVWCGVRAWAWVAYCTPGVACTQRQRPADNVPFCTRVHASNSMDAVARADGASHPIPSRHCLPCLPFVPFVVCCVLCVSQQGLAPRYGQHHGVTFTPQALEAAVHCAKRWGGRQCPSTAQGACEIGRTGGQAGWEGGKAAVVLCCQAACVWVLSAVPGGVGGGEAVRPVTEARGRGMHGRVGVEPVLCQTVGRSAVWPWALGVVGGATCTWSWIQDRVVAHASSHHHLQVGVFQPLNATLWDWRP